MFGYVSLRTAESLLDRVPPLLDRFEIGERLGAGAGGSVYKAYDKKLERHVAIKIPIGLAAGDIAEEAVSQAAVTHLNVPSLLEIGETLDKRVFIVMEYVDGENILDFCKRNRLSLSRRIELLVQICNVAHFIHTNDTTSARAHRDIRAANVIVTNKDVIVKVLDFGLSARLDQLGCDPRNARSIRLNWCL